MHLNQVVELIQFDSYLLAQLIRHGEVRLLISDIA